MGKLAHLVTHLLDNSPEPNSPDYIIYTKLLRMTKNQIEEEVMKEPNGQISKFLSKIEAIDLFQEIK